MAQNDESGNAEQGPLTPAPAKKMGMLIVVGGLLLVILTGGGVFAWMKFSTPSAPDEATVEQQEDAKVEEKEVLGVIVDLAPFIVNLADPGAPRYLKVAMKLEINGQDAVTRFNDRIPQIRDSLLLLLSSQESGEMRGMKGKLLLKEQIFERILVIVGEGSVRSVYLTDFVVQ